MACYCPDECGDHNGSKGCGALSILTRCSFFLGAASTLESGASILEGNDADEKPAKSEKRTVDSLYFLWVMIPAGDCKSLDTLCRVASSGSIPPLPIGPQKGTYETPTTNYGSEVRLVICEKCGKEFFEDWRRDSRQRETVPARFCSRSCANTKSATESRKEKTRSSLKEYYREHPKPKTKKKQGQHEYFQVTQVCTNCGKDFHAKWQRKTCSENCFLEIQSKKTQTNNSLFYACETEFQNWKEGFTADLSSKGVTAFGELSGPAKWRIKEFLLEEQNHKCAICGQKDIWNDLPFTMILDHIDGNSTNHARTNLRLVCPICDTQQPTHGAKNRGKGRHSERLRYYRQKQAVQDLITDSIQG